MGKGFYCSENICRNCGRSIEKNDGNKQLCYRCAENRRKAQKHNNYNDNDKKRWYKKEEKDEE